MNTPTLTDIELDQLRQLVTEAHHIAVFTGAGISTESGIPDFRGPNGIWNTMRPIDFADFIASEDKRRESWRRKFSNKLKMANAKPNSGHCAIAQFNVWGKLGGVITQNIDGLHQASGLQDDKIIELHGNANYATCLSCQRHYDLDWVQSVFEPHETLPICSRCGGIIKTATISFGQAMPEAEMQRAETLTNRCDLFMAIGSSLRVYPAAGFPMLAKRCGATVIIINNEPTDLDLVADLVLHYPIGSTLTALVSKIKAG